MMRTAHSLAGHLVLAILLAAGSAAAQTLELVSRQDVGDGGAQANIGSNLPAT